MKNTGRGNSETAKGYSVDKVSTPGSGGVAYCCAGIKGENKQEDGVVIKNLPPPPNP